MDHGLDIETRVREGLLRLAGDLDLPMIATNDLHYTHAADAATHEVLLCVQSGKTMADPNRFKFDGHDSYYLKSPAEMRSLWADKYDLREACDNTLLIAERCERRPSPRARTTCRGSRCRRARTRTPGSSRRSRPACSGATRTASRRTSASRPTTRSASSSQMGFPGYFLVVADFINWAKENGIRVGPGRGSGAGSMAAYAMRITDLDPLVHGLIFERFLNPDRVSMPDFDIDFDERRRGEVIRYVTDKYGDDRVAQIVTYGTIKAKQAVKDAARVLGFPFSMGERITKVMPPAGHGQGRPARQDLRRGPRPLRRGRRVPRPVRGRRRGQEGRRHRQGPRRPQAPVGRARSGRDHVQRAADRPDPDHEARAGRRDHHAVRLPDLRDARPDQDGLPRAAQPDGPRRRAREHPGQPRRDDGARRAHPRRSAHLRVARPRRHARGLPARRRPDARAAAVDAPGRVRGHLRGHRAVPARPDGDELAQRLRRPQERPQARRADPSPSWRSRSPRSWARPTA